MIQAGLNLGFHQRLWLTLIHADFYFAGNQDLYHQVFLFHFLIA